MAYRSSRAGSNSVLVLEVLTVFLVAVAMALALAHALECPGKMRLSRQMYLATQSIYDPGCTIGGLGAGRGLVTTLVLVLMMPRGTLPFWWSVAGFIVLALMHMVFWTITQPGNRRWFAGGPLTGAARRFFSAGGKKAHGTIDVNQQDQWES